MGMTFLFTALAAALAAVSAYAFSSGTTAPHILIGVAAAALALWSAEASRWPIAAAAAALAAWMASLAWSVLRKQRP